MKKQKCKRIFIIGLIFLFGAAAGGAGGHFLWSKGGHPVPDAGRGMETAALAVSNVPELPVQRLQVVKLACQAVEAMKREDYKELSKLIHPEEGVLFAPYSTVDPETNLTFSAQEIATLEQNTQLYVWGRYSGGGAPIRLTLSDYFKTFVFHTDYTMAPEIGVNQILKTGNSLENVLQVYPDGVTVEFHFPTLSGDESKTDWCSLKLVFQSYQNTYKIAAIVHSEWTI